MNDYNENEGRSSASCMVYVLIATVVFYSGLGLYLFL